MTHENANAAAYMPTVDDISTNVAQAREAHRFSDGRFGQQQPSVPEVQLSTVELSDEQEQRLDSLQRRWSTFVDASVAYIDAAMPARARGAFFDIADGGDWLGWSTCGMTQGTPWT